MVRLHATAATAPAPCSQYCQTVIKITRVCIEPWIGVVHTILLYAIPHLFKRKSEKNRDIKTDRMLVSQQEMRFT